ncbi:MAG TPA: type I-D CRISPR-associated protein Cas10d/Csc3 [Planctomycetes bacterium]|nr:type I-D CRISPR-associated protein Cas10d/Csc3 [Planctomycetota bacterium]
MLTVDGVGQVLDEYVQQFVPAMLRWQYHLGLVKGGRDYPHLPEQSHFAHIVNGVFGLAELVKFLITRNESVPGLDEDAFRKALALYTVHEVHKDEGVKLLGSSQFSIPLERLREEYERLGLDEFAAIDEHLMRAANVHKRSPKHGDLLVSGEAGASRLWLLVRLADTFASVKMPEEAKASLEGYLADLGPAFAPKSPPGKYALYYHEIKDVRGVLTNTIHQAVVQQLADELGFYPLLYFATGTLYLGPNGLDGNAADGLISAVAGRVLQSLTQGGGADAIRDGLRRQKFDFERYVYAFATAEELLQAVHDETLLAKPDARKALKEIDGLVSKRQELTAEWRDTVEERFGIQLLNPKEHKTFNELWSQVWRYLLYVDTLLRDLNPAENRLEWFLRVFAHPPDVADNLRREAEVWARGGIGKYVLVVAYHFLRGPDFVDRPAEATSLEQVLERLHRRVLEAFRQVDTQAGRQAAVAELGLRQDLEAYLAEHLYLSFAPTSQLAADSLAGYVSPKRKGHTGRVCSICNRHSDYVQPLRAGILDDFGRVFSNRVLPAREAPQGNRLWCPVCQLEFIFRKVLGMGLPSTAHYKNSRRIYLYVLPTFSFTPEHLRLFEPLLAPFRRVTGLPVRDYGKGDPGLPRYWLEHRAFDPAWIEDLQEVLEREADKIAGWGGRGFVGERVSLGRIRGQPHYYLITWEKAARDTEPDDARVATRTEAWAKALFAAAVISGLTSCKVYVTERPYLPVADPAELKATITLDGPPPALRGLLGGQAEEVTLYGREKGERSGLERVLDLSAALWTVTAGLRPNKDKDIAGRLGRLNADPLAGAYFYKEYGRENDGQSPYSPFDVACEVLLDIRGGEMMDLVERIASKSLEIALPRGTTRRGKARRYELVFREGVSAMRKAQKMIPEMREAAIGGRRPSEQSIAELKRLTAGTLLKGLERRQESRRGEIFVRARGDQLGRLVGEFVDILVDELYLGRAGGSFARFLRLENSLADGIYYYTDRHLSEEWAAYKAAKRESGEQTDE